MDKPDIDDRTSRWRSLVSTALVLAVAGGVLYILGDGFRGGFLAAFGVDKAMFPLPSEATLISGFEAAIFLAPKVGGFALGIALLAGGIVVLCLGVWRLREKRGFRKIAAFLFMTGDSAPASTLSDGVVKWAGLLVSLVVVGFALVALWVMAWSEGSQLGFDVKDRAESGVLLSGAVATWPHVVATYSGPSGGTSEIDGYVVQSSPQFLAFYANKRVMIVPADRLVEMRVVGETTPRPR